MWSFLFGGGGGGGGGGIAAGENIKRGREKLRKNTKKNGLKGLEIASFWVLNSKHFTGGGDD